MDELFSSDLKSRLSDLLKYIKQNDIPKDIENFFTSISKSFRNSYDTNFCNLCFTCHNDYQLCPFQPNRELKDRLTFCPIHKTASKVFVKGNIIQHCIRFHCKNGIPVTNGYVFQVLFYCCVIFPTNSQLTDCLSWYFIIKGNGDISLINDDDLNNLKKQFVNTLKYLFLKNNMEKLIEQMISHESTINLSDELKGRLIFWKETKSFGKGYKKFIFDINDLVQVEKISQEIIDVEIEKSKYSSTDHLSREKYNSISNVDWLWTAYALQTYVSFRFYNRNKILENLNSGFNNLDVLDITDGASTSVKSSTSGPICLSDDEVDSGSTEKIDTEKSKTKTKSKYNLKLKSQKKIVNEESSPEIMKDEDILSSSRDEDHIGTEKTIMDNLSSKNHIDKHKFKSQSHFLKEESSGLSLDPVFVFPRNNSTEMFLEKHVKNTLRTNNRISKLPESAEILTETFPTEENSNIIMSNSSKKSRINTKIIKHKENSKNNFLTNNNNEPINDTNGKSDHSNDPETQSEIDHQKENNSNSKISTSKKLHNLFEKCDSGSPKLQVGPAKTGPLSVSNIQSISSTSHKRNNEDLSASYVRTAKPSSMRLHNLVIESPKRSKRQKIRVDLSDSASGGSHSENDHDEIIVANSHLSNISNRKKINKLTKVDEIKFPNKTFKASVQQFDEGIADDERDDIYSGEEDDVIVIQDFRTHHSPRKNAPKRITMNEVAFATPKPKSQSKTETEETIVVDSESEDDEDYGEYEVDLSQNDYDDDFDPSQYLKSIISGKNNMSFANLINLINFTLVRYPNPNVQIINSKITSTCKRNTYFIYPYSIQNTLSILFGDIKLDKNNSDNKVSLVFIGPDKVKPLILEKIKSLKMNNVVFKDMKIGMMKKFPMNNPATLFLTFYKLLAFLNDGKGELDEYSLSGVLTQIIKDLRMKDIRESIRDVIIQISQ